jgi:outer membrane porin, OprD family
MRRRAARVFGLALLVAAGAWGPGLARAEDAPSPPPRPPLNRVFDPLDKMLVESSLPAFLKDTDLRVHFRTYYFNRNNPDDSKNEALATGGWISYQSGWLANTFAMGATLYGSAKLYGPEDRDGTSLLKPSQESYYVPGEAWGALKYEDYVIVKGYRQQVDQGYINPQDNRMTPNTFQGVTVGGKVGWMEYLGGYLWKIKPRNADEFISMSEQAGAAGTDDGVGFGGVRLAPLPGLRLDFSNSYGVNTFNTFYAEGVYEIPISEGWKIRLGAQFTDQRAVGDALIRTSEKDWSTQHGGGRVQLVYRDLQLTGAFSIVGKGNDIQNPWGSFPGYISMIDQDFDRAREKAFLLGLAYDFSNVLTKGLSANMNIGWGKDAINPTTKNSAPDQTEYDLTVDYRPPFKMPAFLQGVWFRARGAILDREDARATGYQVRLIINWERDLF